MPESVTHYLERMAEREHPGAEVTVTFDADTETYTMYVDSFKYTFQVGSDDDEFYFWANHDNVAMPRTIRIPLMPA